MARRKNTEEEKKSVVYFISGGHGLQPFIKFISNANRYVHEIVLGSIDDGGHTGMLRRLFADKKEDGTLLMKHLPVGDMRNLIGLICESGEDENLKQIAQKLKARTNDIDEIKDLTVDLVNALGINESSTYFLNIINFLDEYINKYQLASQDITYESDGSKSKQISHNIGNLVLFAILHEYGPTGLIDFVKEFKLVPEHVNLHFFHEEPLVLCAENVNTIQPDGSPVLVNITGEGNIDNFSGGTIHPANLKLRHLDGSVYSSKDLSQNIISIIQKAAVVIIPTGSMENSYPAIDIAGEHIANKIVLRFVNFAKIPRNIDFIREMFHLSEKGIKAFYFRARRCLRLNHNNEVVTNGISEQMLAKYYQQGKKVEIGDLTESEIIYRLRELGLHSEELELKAEEIMNRIFNLLDIQEFPNGKRIDDNGEVILETGLRHDDDIILKVLTYIVENSERFNDYNREQHELNQEMLLNLVEEYYKQKVK